MAILHTDGGASGNPGPAGIGVVLLDADGTVLAEASAPIGSTTNNIAEYTALLRGIGLARERGIRDLDVRLDSELVVRQVTGRYRVKHPGLIPYHREVLAALGQFERYTVSHVPRAENAHADRLAKQGIAAARRPGGGRPSGGAGRP